MPTLSIRLTDDLDRQLETEARRSGTNRSELARVVLADHLRRQEQERFMAELVDEARRLKGDREGLQVAEEWLPIENEAMESAEGTAAPAVATSEGEPWWR